MGGPRITPEQLEQAAEVYERTGNTSEAARAIGCTEGALRAAFKRERITKNSEAHRRAIEKGLRSGRAHLATAVDLIGEQFADELKSGGLEPGERAQCAAALTALVRELGRLKVLDLRTRQAALTRAQTRIAIQRSRKELEGDGSDGPKLVIPAFLLTERPDNDGASDEEKGDS
jgi:hypothetical protein